ncbi:ferredoxin [Cryptosporangium minutisporangium]|uniref:ferredoxin n=1 Tax=Cryptosporangium minutisporangium TaxID=113569 RepID=UPI0035E9F86E
MDRDRCQGSGACLFHYSITFGLDADDRVVLGDDRDPEAALRAAADACPTQAISLADPHQEA